MAGNEKAWKMMEKYNRQDVVLLERLYDRLKPWIRNHPNHSAHSGEPCCTNCGSENFVRNGWAFTQLLKYPRYRCNDCGKYFRGNKTASLRRSERFVAV
jgi:DNA-directed RNA polymerase subunit RPC12/RpoP